MARRFKRRRPRVVWLPMLGNNAYAGGTEPIVGRPFRVPISANGQIIVEAFPVTFDYTDSAQQDQFGTNQFGRTLHDLVSGQEYRLRRLVGKVHAGAVSLQQAENQDQNVPAVHFGAGFIVLKTDDSGNQHADLNEVNPLAQDSSDDPWIWRRVWTLGTVGEWSRLYVSQATILYTDEQLVGSNFPSTTAGYGSVADGPHIDAKTARVIGRQERLYCILATRVWSPEGNSAYTRDGFVYGHLDLRALASLRTGMGNRRNASR